MLKTRYITIALMIMLALSISAFMAITLAYQQFPIGLRNSVESIPVPYKLADLETITSKSLPGSHICLVKPSC